MVLTGYYLFLFVFCFSLQHSSCNSSSECNNVVCPEQVICPHPKTELVLPYPGKEKCCVKIVCTCKGTNTQLTSSGDSKIQYGNLEKIFTNCTLVNGNLELSGLFPYDGISTIEFTRHIEQITGYLLIYRTRMTSINLSSLRLIRGLTQYTPLSNTDCPTNATSRPTTAGPGYSIYVNQISSDTDYVREIWMPQLTEISSGNVKFGNSRLCNIETIKWTDEIFNSNHQTVVIESDNRNKTCSPCPNNCVSGNPPTARCWGSSSNNLCQIITKSKCRIQCGNDRCNAAGACCNGKCAGGCYDNMPATGDKDKWCYACKDMNNNGTCVEACPQGEQMNSVSEITPTLKTYQFARYCVPECPFNVPQTTVFCRTYCPEGTFDYDSNICKTCRNGECENVCYGLGVGHGPLKNDKEINSQNIMHFNKNCTIIEGSLNFQESTFNGDTFCRISQMKEPEKFTVFENVKEITGYLAFDDWIFPDLCLFKNLRKIRGKELKSELYSLYIYTNGKSLNELCLNSLKQIDNGGVLITRNHRLCFSDTISWESLFHNPASQKPLVQQNKCPLEVPCNAQCDANKGCWGRDRTQCVACRHYTDYTDANGQLTPAWVLDPQSGLSVPGYNTTTCVEQCDHSKGVYATMDMKCLPCDRECGSTCNGPTAFNCTSGCLNYELGTQCVPSCPPDYFVGLNQTCQRCSVNCHGGCTGPLDQYGKNGCTTCHISMDVQTTIYTHRGAKCEFCINGDLKETCAYGCTSFNKTHDLECYYPPQPDVTVYIVIGVLLVLIIIIGVSWVFYRHRTTIKRMRQTIGETMVGEHMSPLEHEVVPLTPSGTAPNQAQLRIVKESELEFGKLLGSGAFGTVKKAIWTPLNIQGEKVKIPVAVKTLKTSEDLLRSANNEIMDEAYMMASVECLYLVRLLGVCMAEHVSLITQLMPLGSLLEYVRNPENRDSIRSRQMLSWCVQMAKGMKYLEEKHLVHRDLAARNVLVKTPNHVKITDFGLAKMLNMKEETYHAEGGKLPIKWLAIECITEREFSHLSDVWAFGVTCWELLTFGGRPYEGVRAVEVLNLLERGERLPQPTTSTIEIYMVLVKCWMVDRHCRPTFADLVTEFSKMATDPGRYIVIKHDDPENMMSPTSVDDAAFFRQLLEEENIGGEDLITDEPDQYLLCHTDNQVNNYTPMSPANDNHPLLSEPEYKNVVRDVAQSPDAGISSRDHRLFSRNTPSSFPESSLSSPGTGMPDNHPLEAPQSPPLDADDVFSEVMNTGKATSPIAASVMQQASGRKDSEETQRYTEEPTSKRQMMDNGPTLSRINSGKLPSESLDENQYLLPTPLRKLPDYFDPDNNIQRSSMLCNETYAEPDSLSDTHPYPEPSEGYASVFPKPEYVNADTRNPTWFSNEEYMATDSGIGEDVQSLLSRGNTATRPQRRSNQSQSSVDDPEQIFLNKDAGVRYRPEMSRDSSPDSQPLHETALNNPEYMLLNPSNSPPYHPQT